MADGLIVYTVIGYRNSFRIL